MNTNYTDITILLDKSGSMAKDAEQTIEAVNAFIETQKKGEGKCVLSLVQFATKQEVTYIGHNIHSAPLLNRHSYYADGSSTALRDALYNTIKKTGERLAAMPESERPGYVLFVVQTDGLDNDRYQKHDLKSVVDSIEHQKNNYKWDFVFLGANMDAISSGAAFSFAPTSALSYDKDNSRRTFQKMSENVNNLRSMKRQLCASGNTAEAVALSYAVTEEDRKEAAGANTPTV